MHSLEYDQSWKLPRVQKCTPSNLQFSCTVAQTMLVPQIAIHRLQSHCRQFLLASVRFRAPSFLNALLCSLWMT